MNEVEILVDSETLLGECPVWDVKENVLYWIDIDGYKINCYDDLYPSSAYKHLNIFRPFRYVDGFRLQAECAMLKP